MFNKSLKVLNYAREDNGKLELFTELTNDFIIGDIVYIVGGYYDNCKDLLHINNYTSGNGLLYNPFNKQYQGYRILDINTSINAFTIDLFADTNNLIYPYGTINNPFGNTQTAGNIAYNSHTTNDLYKSVMVSKVVFTFGNFSSGIINNGIFGNDTNSVILNRPVTPNSNVIINHIASKNIIALSCIINSKTDSTITTTTKTRIIEDLSISITNPFQIINIQTNTNNDNFGYNIFERFINTGINETIINNGNFDNPRLDFIKFNNVVINGGRIGASEPTYGVALNNITNINGGKLQSVNIFNNLFINNVNVNTFIPLSVVSATYTMNNNEIEFTVDSFDIFNKDWFIGQVYISGINVTDDFIEVNSNNFATILDVSYTWGDVNSAKILMTFDNIVDWASFKINYPIPDIRFNKLKIHKTTGTNLFNIAIFNNSVIRSFIDVSTYSTPKIYFDTSNIINEGYYKYVRYTGTTKWDGIGYAEHIEFIDNIQQLQFIDEYNEPNIINYSYIKFNLSGGVFADIKNSHIISGYIYNSILENTVVENPLNLTYLYNCTLNNKTKVDSNVFWDNVKINFIADIVVNNTIIPQAYLGERKTAWKTGYETLSPVLLYAENINQLKGSQIINAYYNSQAKILESISNNIPTYLTLYEAPNLNNILTTYTNIDQVSIVDHGLLSFNGNNWQHIANKDRILFSGLPVGDVNTKLRNVFSSDLSNTYNTFPGTAPDNNASNITRVDDNFVIRNIVYNYYSEERSQRDVSISVKKISDIPSNYPSPNTNNVNDIFKLDIITNSGPSFTNISNNDVISLQSSVNTLKLNIGTIYDKLTNIANLIPNSFIEIERIIKTTKDNLNVITDINITNLNYCPTPVGVINGNQYAFNGEVSRIDYPNNFIIKNSTNNIDYTFTTLNFGDIIELNIEYWITWYFNDLNPLSPNGTHPLLFNGFSGGYRTKHTFNVTININNTTFYIIDNNGNTLIDNNLNNILYFE